MSFSLPSDYGYALLAVSGLAFHVIATGSYVGAARSKAFNKEFMASPPVLALLEEHKKATGASAFPKNGYPDMGTGRLAALLPYDSYLRLANAQRAHYNYVEAFGSVAALTLISGLKYPVPSAIAAVTYGVGRALFAHLYVTRGADARYGGGIISIAALLGLFAGAVASGGSIAKLW